MKFNWGHGIVVTMGIAMSLILVLVYFSYQQTIDLVTEDYYPKQLVYENQIDKQKAYESLGEKVEIEMGKMITFKFPSIVTYPDSITGTIHLYRPSNRQLDLQLPILLDSAFSQHLPLSALKNGKYEFIIDWQADGKSYLMKEFVIVSK